MALLTWSVAPLCAQNKLPKIRYSSGFFTERYELGEKDVKKPEIRLHLQQHNNEAYYQFRRSQSLEAQGTVWLILGTAASVLVLAQALQDEPSVPVLVAAGGVGVVGYTASIICFTIGGTKNQKAIDIYNRAAGY